MPDELPFIANAIKTITPEKTPEIARKLAIDKAKEVIAAVTLSNAESETKYRIISATSNTPAINKKPLKPPLISAVLNSI